VTSVTVFRHTDFYARLQVVTTFFMGLHSAIAKIDRIFKVTDKESLKTKRQPFCFLIGAGKINHNALS